MVNQQSQDTSWIPCLSCWGDGRLIVSDNERGGYKWQPCAQCNSKGKILKQ
ncbi:hypothetical protein [Nostoc sp. MG11]|uniref:hypothetical protein n=1 Tax=Nostoc sp. MG11 TaxID=2721166 RepID=UPI00186867EB|nr:hypothetical protein [Nostoc sp. MG11]